MVYSFQETDTASVCAVNVYCSGLALSGHTSVTRQAIYGGTVGSASTGFSLDSLQVDKVNINFELPVTAGITWSGGTWVVRLHITTALASCTWEDCYICRVNSACVNQATIASKTGMAIDISTNGTKIATVTGGIAQSPTPGDKVIIVLSFSKSNSGVGSLAFTPDALIDSPFQIPLGAISTLDIDFVNAYEAQAGS